MKVSEVKMIVDKFGNEAWNITKKNKLVTFTTDDGTKALSITEFRRKYFEDELSNDDNISTLSISQDLELKTLSQLEEEEEQMTEQLVQNEIEIDTTLSSSNLNVNIHDIDEITNAIKNQFFDIDELTLTPIAFGQNNAKFESTYDHESKLATITIGLKAFSVLTYLDFAVKLCHEFCHIQNLISNTKDTCGGGSYHNENFKLLADDLYLTSEKTRGQGWGNLVHTQKFINKMLNVFQNSTTLHMLTSFDSIPQVVVDTTTDKMQLVREAKINTQQQLDALRAEVKELKAMIQLLLDR
jgi:hypothetical protein